MIRRLLLAGACALTTSPLFAQVQNLPQNSIDARLLVSGYVEEFDGDELEISGVGAELRGEFAASDSLSLRGRYSFSQSDEVDLNGETFDADTDISLLRLGASVQVALQAIRIYGALDFAQVETEIEGESNDENGYVISGGIRDLGQGPFIWNVELGYVDIGDASGVAIEGNLGYQVTPSFALIGGIDSYGLEDDFDVEIGLANISFGGRFSF